MGVTCIYHSRDLDGYTSGAIVKRKYPDAKLIGYDYGQEIPWDQIPEGEPVIIIDVSLAMPDMLKLANYSNRQLTWIDHHISAINDYKEYLNGKQSFLTAVLKDGFSACENGWNYLFPDLEMPESVLLLGQYDTWRNQDEEKWDSEILPFQYGMRLICNSPETFPIDLFDSNESIPSIINDGKLIIKYQSQQDQKNCASNSFESIFKGKKAICLNGGGFSSNTFNSIYDPEKHDLMIPFQYNGKDWTFSLYTTKDEIDCSEIAKSMGGGGHKKAAGFKVDSLTKVFDAPKL